WAISWVAGQTAARARSGSWEGRTLRDSAAVAAIAQRLVGGGLAGAEVEGLRFGGLVLEGGETAVLVGTVAERLLLALAAGAPVVGLAGFHGNGNGCVTGAYRLGHGSLHQMAGGAECSRLQGGRGVLSAIGGGQRKRSVPDGHRQGKHHRVGAGIAVAEAAVGEVVEGDAGAPVPVQAIAEFEPGAKFQLRAEVDTAPPVVGGDIKPRGEGEAPGEGEIPAQPRKVEARIVLRHHRPQHRAQPPPPLGPEAVLDPVAPAVAGAVEQANHPGIELYISGGRGGIALPTLGGEGRGKEWGGGAP